MGIWWKYLSTVSPLVWSANESIHWLGTMGSCASLACQHCHSREGIRRPWSSTLRKNIQLKQINLYLKIIIKKEHLWLVLLIQLPILIQKSGLWQTLSITLGMLFFTVTQTILAAHQTANPKKPNNTSRATCGYTQVWAKFMCLILGYKHLKAHAS